MRQEKKSEAAAAKKAAPLKIGNVGNMQVDNTSFRPTMKWRDLIRQFVATRSPPELSYARPSARGAAQADIGKQTGVSAIKPGERITEEVFKLLLVFDTSGSMSQAIGPALAESRALLSVGASNTDSALGVCFFASEHFFFAANLRNKKGWVIPSFSALTKSVPAESKRPLDEILRFRSSGGTDFNSGFAAELAAMAAKGYNIVLFSDDGIMDSGNWENFINLYKSHRQKFFFIADTINTYNNIVKKLGSQPRTFGCLQF